MPERETHEKWAESLGVGDSSDLVLGVMESPGNFDLDSAGSRWVDSDGGGSRLDYVTGYHLARGKKAEAERQLRFLDGERSKKAWFLHKSLELAGDVADDFPLSEIPSRIWALVFGSEVPVYVEEVAAFVGKNEEAIRRDVSGRPTK